MANAGLIQRSFVPLCEGRRIRNYDKQSDIPEAVYCDICDGVHLLSGLAVGVVYSNLGLMAERTAGHGEVPPFQQSGTLTFDIEVDCLRPQDTEGQMVFVSYSHDTDSHSQRVLDFAQELRQVGIDCVIDLYVNGTPSEGWPLWMQRQIEVATFVLVVCTEKYHQRWAASAPRGTGLGATWESVLVRQELYNGAALNEKYVPILFDEGDAKHIPSPLQPATRYVLPRDRDRLLRYLTTQPEVLPRPLGQLPVLPPRSK